VTSLGDVGARGGEERRFEMPTKGKKSLSNFRKDEILRKCKEILTCGNKEMADAYAALIEDQVRILRLRKKK
jgi:hypothetical protein